MKAWNRIAALINHWSWLMVVYVWIRMEKMSHRLTSAALFGFDVWQLIEWSWLIDSVWFSHNCVRSSLHPVRQIHELIACYYGYTGFYNYHSMNQWFFNWKCLIDGSLNKKRGGNVIEIQGTQLNFINFSISCMFPTHQIPWIWFSGLQMLPKYDVVTAVQFLP